MAPVGRYRVKRQRRRQKARGSWFLLIGVMG